MERVHAPGVHYSPAQCSFSIHFYGAIEEHATGRLTGCPSETNLFFILCKLLRLLKMIVRKANTSTAECIYSTAKQEKLAIYRPSYQISGGKIALSPGSPISCNVEKFGEPGDKANGKVLPDMFVGIF